MTETTCDICYHSTEPPDTDHGFGLVWRVAPPVRQDTDSIGDCDDCPECIAARVAINDEADALAADRTRPTSAELDRFRRAITVSADDPAIIHVAAMDEHGGASASEKRRGTGAQDGSRIRWPHGGPTADAGWIWTLALSEGHDYAHRTYARRTGSAYEPDHHGSEPYGPEALDVEIRHGVPWMWQS